jgi:hypothetical protein
MSTLKVNTLQNTSGVEVYTAKAWVNFNGTGTVAIRASGNVSSITDNGTGNYTVNFTNALADTNYSAVSSCENIASFNFMVAQVTTRNTTSLVTDTRNNAASAADASSVYVSVFR